MNDNINKSSITTGSMIARS